MGRLRWGVGTVTRGETRVGHSDGPDVEGDGDPFGRRSRSRTQGVGRTRVGLGPHCGVSTLTAFPVLFRFSATPAPLPPNCALCFLIKGFF